MVSNEQPQKSILQTLTSTTLSDVDKLKTLPRDPVSKEALVDCLWCLIGVVSDDEKDKYSSLLNEVLNDTDIDINDQMAMTRLSLEVLKRYTDRFAGIDPGLIHRKIIKENTNLVYRQRKFNLFREESEGFAKLLRCLCERNESDTAGDEQIKGLIGLFELDPTRVADTVFGSLIYKVSSFGTEDDQRLEKICSAEIQYLKTIRHIQHLIGMTLPTENPSFFRAVALLLKYEVTTLPLLMPHFMTESVNIQVMVKETSDYYENLIQALKKFGPSSTLPEHELQSKDEHPILALLDAVLEHRSWENARGICLHLYSTNIDPFVCKPSLLGKVRSYLSSLVESVYCQPDICITGPSDMVCEKNQSSQCDDAYQFFEKFLSIMEIIQHTSVFQNQDILLAKIVVTLKRYTVDQAFHIPHKRELFKVLLHSLNVLGQPNVHINSMMWQILSKELTWQDRYKLYHETWEWGNGNIRALQTSLVRDYKSTCDILLQPVAGQKPLSVIIALITTSYKASHVLKRTSSENVNLMAPMLAKVAGLVSPLSTIKVLVNIVGNYENMGELMIEGMQFWGSLGRDVVGYELRWRLMNNPTAGAQVGFQAFLASFYRDYSSVEVDGILEFLYKDIGKGNVANVEILRGLLSVAGGMPSWSTQSPLQLYARAGGVFLQNATTSFGQTIKSKTSDDGATILRRKLMPYGINLAARLAHLRETVVFVENTKQLAVYDNITGLMFKLLDFLQYDLSHWRELFDGVENLDNLKLSKSVTFSFIRPLLENSVDWKLVPPSENVVETQFYRYGFGDIYCPIDLYNDEISTLSQVKKDELRAEMKSRSDHVNEKVEALKSALLSNDCLDGFDLDSFIGCHILPRALLTSSDALYCSKFLQLVVDTCSLKKKDIYSYLFSYVRGFLFSMTEEEADNFGLFLFDTWSHIASLRYEETATIETEIYDGWHTNLALNLIMALICSEELISRVALKVLIRIVSVYPTKAHVGQVILKRLEPIQKEESSNKALANSYFGQLMKARNDGIWREEDSKVEAEREEQERIKQEERREKLRQQDQALAAEVANYDSMFPNDRDRERDRGRTSRRDGGDRDRRSQGTGPKFVPRNTSDPDSRAQSSSKGNTEGLDERWQRKGGQPEKRNVSPVNIDEMNKRKRTESQQERNTRGGGYGRDRDRGRGYNR